MSIGEKIYELRKNKNMSQEELANVLNVSRQTISKWETGESNPDFDKIVPLCNFFEISTDEFLRGGNPVLEETLVRVSKRNKALTFSLCIIIFFVMCILDAIFEEIGVNDVVIASISLAAMGAIAVILVYYFLSKSDEEVIKKNNVNKKRRLIHSILMLLTLIIYLVVSYFFGWEYTWIIFIIGLLIVKVVDLILLLGDEKNEK